MNPQDQTPYEPTRGSQFVDYRKQNGGAEGATPPPLPPVPPSAPVRPVRPVRPPRSPRKGKGMLIAVLILLIILAGGGYAAYAMVSPNKAISGALEKIRDADKIRTEVHASYGPADGSSGGGTVSILTDSDASSPSGLELQSAVTAVSSDMSASAELRLIGKTVYMKIAKIPAQYAGMLGSFAGRWYSIPLSTVQGLGSGYVGTSTIERMKSEGVISGGSFAGIAEYSGDLVRRYALAIDTEALARVLISAAPENAGGEYTDEVRSHIDEFPDAIAIDSVTVDVGLFSGALRHVALAATITDPDGALRPEDTVRVQIDLSYDDTPPEFSISAPSGATSLSSLLGGSLQIVPKR